MIITLEGIEKTDNKTVWRLQVEWLLFSLNEKYTFM